MENRFFAALLLAALPASALAAEQRLPELPSVASVLETIRPQGLEPIRVSMDIRSVFSGDRYDIRDPFARIELSVDREAGGKAFRFGGDVDGRYLTGTVEARADGSWEIWGGGLNIDMRKRGAGDYEISGFVDEADGSKNIYITLSQRGAPGNFDIWSNGVSLNFSKFASDVSVSGQIDPRWFGKKSLALVSVYVAVLEAALDKPVN